MTFPHINHGLNGKYHALFECQARIFKSIWPRDRPRPLAVAQRDPCRRLGGGSVALSVVIGTEHSGDKQRQTRKRAVLANGPFTIESLMRPDGGKQGSN